MPAVHMLFFQGRVFETQQTDSLSTIGKHQASERNTKLVHSAVLRQRYIGANYQCKYIGFNNTYFKKANQGIKSRSLWRYLQDVVPLSKEIVLSY